MILVLRALGVGDLATAVPALRGLRAAFPRETLALAAPRWLAPLVDLVGVADRQMPVESLAPGRWRGRAPRVAVNLHGRGPQSHRLLRAAHPDHLLAFATPEFPSGPQWSDQEHEVDRWCRLLAWYGIPADRSDLALRVPPDRHPAGLTVVHPGAKSPRRRWPAERFAAVARTLARTGHRVVVTGAAAERALARRVARLAGLPDSAVLAGRTDTGQLAGLVAGARLVVSGDTGIAHLATAYGTPSVVLFASVPPERWGPPPDRPWHRVLWHPELAGAPSRGRAAPTDSAGRTPPTDPHPALLAVTVPAVLAAAEAALAHREPRHAVAAQ